MQFAIVSVVSIWLDERAQGYFWITKALLSFQDESNRPRGRAGIVDTNAIKGTWPWNRQLLHSQFMHCICNELIIFLFCIGVPYDCFGSVRNFYKVFNFINSTVA